MNTKQDGPKTNRKTPAAATAILIALLVALSVTGGCLRLKKSPFDSSTLLGLLLQGWLARQPIALAQYSTYSVFQSQRGMNRPLRIAFTGSRAFLTDQNSERVLGYLSLPTQNHVAADIALGVQDASTVHAQVFALPDANPRGIAAPVGVATDGTRLVVSDNNSHRILVWNNVPSTSFEPADIVLGQANFSGVLANRGGAAAGDTVSGPTGVAICGSRLFVADTTNNRVLVWNTFPTQNGQSADFALGQPNLSGVGVGTSATTFSGPEDVYCDGQRAYVADTMNNRVLIWNSIPSASGTAANVAVGQPDLTSGGLVLSAAGMNRPKGVFAQAGGALVVGDTINNRVLIFDTIPTVDGTSASRVLGQPDFMSNTANNGGPGVGLNEPEGVSVDAQGRLFAVEKVNNRVSVWPKISVANHEAISFVMGQPTPSTTPSFWNSGIDGFFVRFPVSVGVVDGNLLTVSALDSRIPSWAGLPLRLSVPFSQIFGQTSVTTSACNQPGLSAQSLCSPAGFCHNGTDTFISDGSNHRILVFSGLPAPGSSAKFVLGQPNFTSNMPNAGLGAADINTVSSPQGLYCDANRLIAADGSNNRVLIWNLPVTVNQQSAALVIGQGAFNTNAASTGPTGLDGPLGAAVIDNRLIVADGSNNRVLIYNPIPTGNGASASLVLGQPDFLTNGANSGSTPTARSMFRPFVIRSYRGRFIVGDTVNNRFLIWDTFPTQNAQAADRVFGQPNFTENIPNNRGTGPHSLNLPVDMTLQGERVLIADYYNHRILVMEPDEFLGL